MSITKAKPLQAIINPKNIINVTKKYICSFLNIFKNINKQYNEDFTKNPLKYIENPVGAST
jgi:hypothetical protein